MTPLQIGPAIRWKRVGRVAGRVVLGLLSLVLVTVAAVLVVLHTDWGREQVRRRVERALDDALIGGARIARLEGSVLGDLTVRGVVLEDAERTPAISADAVRVELALLPLLGKRVQLDRLAVSGLVVEGRERVDGTINLATLTEQQPEPAAPAPADDGSGWTVAIDELVIDGRLGLDRAAAEDVHLDGVRLGGSVVSRPRGRIEADVELAAAWRERGALPVRARATAERSLEAIEIAAASLAVGEIKLDAHDVRVAGLDVRGEATVVAPAVGVRRLVPDSPLRGDLRIALRAAPAADGSGASHVVLEGRADDARLTGDLVLDPTARRVRGTVAATDVDAAALVRGGTPTRLGVRLAVDLRALEGERGVAALVGDVTVHADGRVERVQLESFDGEVRLDRGEVRAELDGALAGGTTASLDALVRLLPSGVLEIETAHLVADAKDLSKLGVAPAKPLAGAIALDLTARGRVDRRRGPAMSLSGTINGARLRYDRTRAEALHLEIHAGDLPSAPRGVARLEVRGVVDQGRRVGAITVLARSTDHGALAITARSRPDNRQLAIDLDAAVRFGEVIRVAIGSHRIATRGVVWSGKGGVVEIYPTRVIARDLRTSVAGGGIALAGTLQTKGPRAGDLVGSLDLTKLDLAKVDHSLESVDLADPRMHLSGTVDLAVRVERRRSRWSGSARAELTDVRFREGPPTFSGALAVTAAPGKLTIDGDLRAWKVGSVDLEVDVAAPARLEDAGAWRRLERRAIRRGRLSLEALDLAMVARIVQGSRRARGEMKAPTPFAGRVDAELTMTAADTQGWLRTRGVTAPGWAAATDADLTLERVALGVVRAKLGATARRLGTARAETTVALPTRPFDPAAWAAVDLGALGKTTIEVDEVALDAERSRLLGLREPWAGRVALEIEIAPAVRAAVASVTARGLRGGPLARPTDAGATLRYDGRRLTATANAAFERRPVLTASGSIPLELAALHGRRFDALRGAPIVADLKLDRASVASIRRSVGAGGALEGTLSLDAAVRGTIAKPTVRARGVLAGLGLAGQPRLRELRLDARYDGADAHAEVVGRGARGGSLHLVVDATLGARPRGTASLVATRFDLTPLGYLAPPSIAGVDGILDAELAVRGSEPETASVAGWLRLRDARLPLSPDIGSVRHGRLDVQVDEHIVKFDASGQVGRGRLTAKGRAALAGVSPTDAEVEVVADDITMLSELQPRIDATLNARARRSGSTWYVDGEVREARVIIPDDKGHALHPRGAPPDMAFIENGVPVPAEAETEQNTDLRIGVRPGTPSLVAKLRIASAEVRSKELRGEVRGKLALYRGSDAVALEGNLRVSRGKVELFDRFWRLDRATVRFDGAFDPVLDIQLTHEFEQLTMFVEVRGRVSEPTLTLRSDPATYSEGQLFAFLLGGKPGSEDDRGDARATAAGAATGFLGKQVAGYVDDYLPVELDVLRYDAESAGSPASLTVGKWLTDRLFVAYRRNLEARPEQNSGQGELEYWFNRNVLAEGVAGDRGIHGLDLLWIRRW
jgi:translocation and assembly module TamB